MLKKISIILFLMLLLSSVSFCAGKQKSTSIGIDHPFLGWFGYNDKKEIISDYGINLEIGVSLKSYFNPLKADEFNMYWCVGTFVLIIPYIGIGGDYVWSNGFYLGAGLIYVIPEIHGGFMF